MRRCMEAISNKFTEFRGRAGLNPVREISRVEAVDAHYDDWLAGKAVCSVVDCDGLADGAHVGRLLCKG